MDGSGELGGWLFFLFFTNILKKSCAIGWRKNAFGFGSTVNTTSSSGWRVVATQSPIAICLGEFVTGVMRIVLLMSRDFTPYWKWLAFEFRKRPEAQPYLHMLDELVSIRLIERQVEIVRSVCR